MQHRMKPVERNFHRALTDLRRARVPSTKETKPLEEDIAYLINTINTYGFGFFPNMYVWESVNELQQKVDALIKMKQQ